jgi:hypothetical protein
MTRRRLDYADNLNPFTAGEQGLSWRGRHNADIGMTQVMPTSA